MLKKLIKYDLLWINKLMIIYFVIALILSILTRILSFFDSSFVGNLIYQILKGITISAYASCLINSVIRVWVRLKNTTYKDESYLIHTLPIEKKVLYNSKIISFVLSLAICLIWIILCFVIAFLNKDVIDYLKIMFNNSLWIFIGIIITAIIEIIYMMFCGTIGILLGHEKNDKRTMRSVIWGLVLYFGLQNIILAIVFGVGLFNSDINLLFNNTATISDIEIIKPLIITVDIVYLLVIACLYFLGKKIFMKGVNVE